MFAPAPGASGASGVGWWLRRRRRGALLLAPALVGDAAVAAMAATASAQRGLSNTGSNGRLKADWVIEDTEGLRMTKHPLPDYPMSEAEARSLNLATEVIERLTNAGCLALIAGGWVRDKFLQRPSSDIDIATSATNAQLKRLFPRVVDLPRNTVKVPYGGELFEISTFRGYSRADGLVSAAADAEARDFTVNALYYCPRHRSVLDFVGGVADIQRRTLRLSSGILGDHVGRLIEDPLRVLRAVRFAVSLDLRLAPDTAKLLTQHAYRCSVAEGVPPRRIWLELRKLAAKEDEAPGTWPKCLALSYHLGLLPHLFPWMRGSGGTAAQHAVRAAARLSARYSSGEATGSSSSSSSGGAESSSGVVEGGGSSGSGAEEGGGGLPLELRVAALVHPGSLPEAYEQAMIYFKSPDEQSTIETLAFAAQLAQQHPTPTEQQQQQQQQQSAPGDESWARVYGHEHGTAILEALAAWMPEETAERFLSHHARNRRRLGALVDAAADARREERARAAAEAARDAEARRARWQRGAAGAPFDAVAALSGVIPGLDNAKSGQPDDYGARASEVHAGSMEAAAEAAAVAAAEEEAILEEAAAAAEESLKPVPHQQAQGSSSGSQVG